MGKLNHRVSQAWEVQSPVPGDVAFSGQVKLVVTPESGDSVGSSDGPPTIGPPNNAVRVAVEIDPLTGEVPELRHVLDFQVCGTREHCPLNRNIKSLDFLHLLHPGERVVSVENNDESGTESSVLLPPELHNLI